MFVIIIVNDKYDKQIVYSNSYFHIKLQKICCFSQRSPNANNTTQKPIN